MKTGSRKRRKEKRNKRKTNQRPPLKIIWYMEKLKEFFEAALKSNLFVLFLGGVFGSLIYAIQKKMNFFQSLITVFTGGAGAVFLGPLIVAWSGLGHSPQICAGVGFITGMLVKEVAEIIIKILDELEKNPAFIIDIIKSKFKK